MHEFYGIVLLDSGVDIKQRSPHRYRFDPRDPRDADIWRLVLRFTEGA